MQTKPSNPKDVAALTRIPLWLCSFVAKVNWALAQAAGLIKYGAWNWRKSGVRASVYLSAAERHLEKWKCGETFDKSDRTHHLGNAMACCAILMDAEYNGMLVDDRPPMSADLEKLLKDAEDTLAHLRETYGSANPRHFTIADTEECNNARVSP